MFQISAIGNSLFFDLDGNPAIGHKLLVYLSRTSEKVVVYTDINGTAEHTNPIILDERGMVPVPIYIDISKQYKFVYTGPDDTDPPASPIYTIDAVGVGFGEDVSSTQEWVIESDTPGFVNTTQFTIPGNRLASYNVGRRVKAVSDVGTIYGTITASAFAAGSTTVTIVPDTGVLDSTLHTMYYGFLSAASSAWPGGMNNGLETIFAGPVTVPLLSSFNLLPVGTVIRYAGNTSPPAGYLSCNGAAVSRTTYAILFGAIASLFGAGDGSTTFNVPNIATVANVKSVIRYA